MVEVINEVGVFVGNLRILNLIADKDVSADVNGKTLTLKVLYEKDEVAELFIKFSSRFWDYDCQVKAIKEKDVVTVIIKQII